MKILLISLAARGHAVADALSRSPKKPDIISITPSRNPGLASIASEMHIANPMDFGAILDIAKKVRPDFAFIAPDDPIGAGLADALETIGVSSVAPNKKTARIESSKGFTRNLLSKYAVNASPEYRVFTKNNKKEIRAFLDELENDYVVKYDALKGGKGVKVSGEHIANPDEGAAYALECIAECGQVVIEKKLAGVEFSLMSFVSGKNVVDMPAVQDHKRAYNGDTGPNTGGMGSYSDTDHSLPFLKTSDIARAGELNRLTADAIFRECGEPFKGILYGGFIATKDGVRIIEYNARFGDPEALNVLPLLSSDFVDICLSIINGNLKEEHVEFARKATVCKYITPDCYPESKDREGFEVRFPELPENARIFYGDIKVDAGGALLLGGSRAAGIVGIGDSISEAENTAQSLCMKVEGPVRFRSDIGSYGLIASRVSLLNKIRQP